MALRDNLCAPCARNPQKAIAYAWFTSIILVAIAFICACVAAKEQVRACVHVTLLLCAVIAHRAMHSGTGFSTIALLAP
jgi:hypothetical protein